MSKKQETAQSNTNQTNAGNEVDPIASAEQRKAENAELFPEEEQYEQAAPIEQGAAAMKLFHFCRASDLDSIAEKGLCPHVPKESVMSLGQEVVWLTEDPSTDVTEADLDHWRRGGGFTESDLEETRRHGWLLESGRTHCLTVRIRTDGKKLQHYATWMRLNGDIPISDENGRAWANDGGELYSARHVLERQCPRIVEKWWVYFGRVPRSAIEGLPARQARFDRGGPLFLSATPSDNVRTIKNDAAQAKRLLRRMTA
jgi:hypothetical protein